MLKPISRLRSICKGDLNILTCSNVHRIRKKILHSIPVLSIFVLLGIIGYTIISPNNLVNLLSIGLTNADGEVYAAESTSNTSSLIIDNGDLTQSNNTTTEGNVTYSSHTVQVIANNIEGYSLNITGPANMTTANTSNPTTITGANNKTPANMANNTWGYAWGSTSTANTSLSYNSFAGSDQTLETNSSATSVNFTKKLVFAAKFDQNAVEGHYKANVKLNLAVTPKALTADFSVNYNMNGGTGGPENMSLATNDPTFTSYTYTIPDTVPTKTGYWFLGWNNGDDTDTLHYPGENITLTKANYSVTLSAVWSSPATTWDDLTFMQDMTSAICSSIATGTEKVLLDVRGIPPYKAYSVRKLTDNNCWMVDNLKLDLSKVTLTSRDSNVSSEYIAGTAKNVTSSANWLFNSNDPAQFNMNGYGKTTYRSGYGYYYSWYAATAGTGTYSMTNSDASSSICPKGWRLPSGGSGGDFQTLYNKYTKTGSTTNNGMSGRWLGAESASAGGAFFPFAGYVGDTANAFVDPGTFGDYWSRTAYSGANYAYYLNFSSSNANPVNYLHKPIGLPIRCIAYSS